MEKTDKPVRDRASYEPNSHAYREQKKKEKIEPVAKGRVVVKKQSIPKRFMSELFANNSKTIGQYIFEDVFMPTVKDLLYSIGVGSLGMLFLGEDRAPNRPRSGYENDRVSWATPYRDISNGKKRNTEPKHKRLDYREVLFRTRAEAEDVLRYLNEYLYDYGNVSLLNFYELAGVDEDRIRFTDDKYGWENLDRVSIVHDKENNGYYIAFPKAVPLD